MAGHMYIIQEVPQEDTKKDTHDVPQEDTQENTQDVTSKCKSKWNNIFVGYANQDDIYTASHHPACGLNITCHLASSEYPEELDDDDPCMEEIEWGTSALLDPAQVINHDRSNEGYDRRVHGVSRN